jgi:hypothetical protein
MRNWQKWRENAAARSARATRAAEARWARYHAADDSPPRETRFVELTLRDSHRPMRIVRMEADETQRGEWGRWAVTEDGQRIGRRRLGRSGIADLLSRSLE